MVILFVGRFDWDWVSRTLKVNVEKLLAALL